MSDKELTDYCRQFIRCDYCGEGHPKQRCSRCQRVYYCSRNCQSNHWQQEHKSDCFPIEDSKKMHETGLVDDRVCLEADDETRRQVLEGNPHCAICLEQPMVRPVVLDKCHHAFCSCCLQNWSSLQSTTTSNCPLCRQEIPDMAESIIQDILMLLASAEKANASESFRQEQFSRALEKMEQLKEIKEAEEDAVLAESYHQQILAFQIGIHEARKDYDAALEVACQSEVELRRAVLNGVAIEAHLTQLASTQLCPLARFETAHKVQDLMKNPSSLPFNHISVMMKAASIMVLQEDWQSAMMTFRNIIRLYPDGDQWEPVQKFSVFMGLSHCFYECCDYEAAIEFGLEAVATDPYLPGCRQYVVLAYLAMGNKQQKAQQCAAEAVIYEAPWDEEHQAKMRDFFRQHFLKT